MALLLLALPPKINFNKLVEVIGQHCVNLDREKIRIVDMKVVIIIH